jgi:hypothetical protein
LSAGTPRIAVARHRNHRLLMILGAFDPFIENFFDELRRGVPAAGR